MVMTEMDTLKRDSDKGLRTAKYVVKIKKRLKQNGSLGPSPTPETNFKMSIEVTTKKISTSGS